MIQLIKALRLPECILVVFLGFIGFKYANIQTHTLTLVALFFVVAVTMLQNDWRDRFHDIGKGKTLANNKTRLFLIWLILFWITSFSLIAILFVKQPLTAVLLLCMTIIGALYSETRRIPLLPVTLVSLTAASPLLLPLTFGANYKTIGILFIASVLIMLGRETLHDIADADVDQGYKKTVPVYISDRFARTIAAIALIIGCLCVIYISRAGVVGSIFIAWGLSAIARDTFVITVRKRVDIGLAFLALGLTLI